MCMCVRVCACVQLGGREVGHYCFHFTNICKQHYSKAVSINVLFYVCSQQGDNCQEKEKKKQAANLCIISSLSYIQIISSLFLLRWCTLIRFLPVSRAPLRSVCSLNAHQFYLTDISYLCPLFFHLHHAHMHVRAFYTYPL